MLTRIITALVLAPIFILAGYGKLQLGSSEDISFLQRLAADPNVFDRNAILQPLVPGMAAATERILRQFGPVTDTGREHTR